MVLSEQRTAMIDFIEQNPVLVGGLYLRSSANLALAKELWQECAVILNTIAPNCPKKSVAQWRRYYHEYESRLLATIVDGKNNSPGETGVVMLTPLQKRLYRILRQKFKRSYLYRYKKNLPDEHSRWNEVSSAEFVACAEGHLKGFKECMRMFEIQAASTARHTETNRVLSVLLNRVGNGLLNVMGVLASARRL